MADFAFTYRGVVLVARNITQDDSGDYDWDSLTLPESSVNITELVVDQMPQIISALRASIDEIREQIADLQAEIEWEKRHG